MKKLGMDFLGAFGLPPPALVHLAADLGCASVSTLPAPLSYPDEGYPIWSLRTDAALRREMKAALRDRAIKLELGEGFLIAPGLGAKDYAADLELMAELGAPRINVVGMDPDLTRNFDEFAAMAEMAAAAGIATVTEFAPCFTVADLPTAVAAAKLVGRPDFSLVIDTMHLLRSGGTAADVAALDPALIGYVQLCDVPLKPAMADYMEEAMYERLAPGEGDAPLADVLKAIPPGVVISLEIPERAKALAGVHARHRLAHCVEAARRLMKDVAAAPA